jgi:DNA repair exonuclease SbcCD ATPase subunit
LREQVSSLSADLQDERARHAGSRKRAAIDRDDLQADMKEKHRKHVLDIKQEHAENIADTIQHYEAKMIENEAQANAIYEKLRTEYGLLQASFKNFSASTQEDFNKQLEMKQVEWEWNKQRAVDDAKDWAKMDAEKKFAVEREQIKNEFLGNIETLMKKQREEISEIHKKYTDGSMEIEDLRLRSDRLDVVEAELADTKEKLNDERKTVKRLKRDLDNTTVKLQNLEQQFDERVSAVDDKHRSKIESLLMERADARLMLARSCEELQNEKIARELAENERKEAAIGKLEDKIRETDEKIKSALKPTPKKTKHCTDPSPSVIVHAADDKPDDSDKQRKQASVTHVTFALDDTAQTHNFTAPHPSSATPNDSIQVSFSTSTEEVETKKEKISRTLSAPIRQPLRFSVPPLNKTELRPSTVSLSLTASGHSPYKSQSTTRTRRTRSPLSRSKSPDTIH